MNKRFDEIICICFVFLFCCQAGMARTLYVNAARPNDLGAGTSWSTAKKLIQSAVALAADNDEILVANGTYASIQTSNKKIVIRSQNGAATTSIDGGSAARCATLGSMAGHTNTVLRGFTLKNGNAKSGYGGGAYYGTLDGCILTSNTAYCGGGASSSTLTDCTLTNNTAAYDGGGVHYGIVSRCSLTGNSAVHSGGGSYSATLSYCSLSGNSASSGGGSSSGTLSHCSLSGNSATSGGGSYFGTLSYCSLSGNSATSGGGSYFGTLVDCLLYGNSAQTGGGGASVSTMRNCTVAGNIAGTYAAGCFAGTLYNSIVWGNNLAGGGEANYSDNSVNKISFNYSCTSPKPSGSGNIAADPLFADVENGDYSLSSGSPCLNAGLDGYVQTQLDLAGNARIRGGRVDMGAYEGPLTGFFIMSQVQGNGIVSNASAYVEAGGSATFHAYGTGGRPVVGFLTNGVYAADTVEFTWNGIQADGIITAVFSVELFADAARPDDVGDGFSWATAKKTLQAAIDASLPGEEISVADGIYGPIATLNKAIVVRSVSGPENAIIDGAGSSRCATLGALAGETRTVLSGLTLRNGLAQGGNGGGSYYGTLTNCVLEGNTAAVRGGGSYYGTLLDCTLSGNVATNDGGGAFGAGLRNCRLTGNTAAYGGAASDSSLTTCTLIGNRAKYGGGTHRGSLNGCTLTNNTAIYYGGGFYYGALVDCMIVDNHSEDYAGAGYSGTLSRCKLIRNSAEGNGGGVVYGTLKNCLLVGNTAWWNGGGGYDATLNNCTLVYNTAGNEGGDYYGGSLNNGISWRNGLVWGTVSGDDVNPLFIDEDGGDFRLRPGSPYLDVGPTTQEPGETDLLGNPRIQGVAMDGGACEGAVVGFVIRAHAKGVGALSSRTALVDAGGSATFQAFPTVRPFVCFLTNGVFATGASEITWTDIQSDGVVTAMFESEAFYVDPARPDDSGDGLTWDTAKKSLQSAIDIALVGDIVWGTNGIHSPITTSNKAIEIRSVNGAASTFIDGGSTTRCATLGETSSHTNTVLGGFTLRNGFAGSGGGAVYGTLDQCTLSGNTATGYGGGAFGGTLDNCTLTGNSAGSGGGASYCRMNGCTVSLNSAANGGGVYDSTLTCCTLIGNTASQNGGGACDSSLFRCRLSANTATGTGGGAQFGSLDNCVVYGNAAQIGGATSSAGLSNCTVYGNRATSAGGGVYNGGVANSIVWGNEIVISVSGEVYRFEDNYMFVTPDACCTSPLPSFGDGNICANPLFVDAASGDFSLQDASYCHDSGADRRVLSDVDFNGNPRIRGAAVDIGAYEGHVAGYVVKAVAQGHGSVSPPHVFVVAGGSATFTATATDRPLVCMLTNGVSATVGSSFTWSGIRSAGVVTAVFHSDLFVDAARPHDGGDGFSLSTAKKTIQGAVLKSYTGDNIWVSDGVYGPISTSNKTILIKSIHGAEHTVIDGGGTQRCALLAVYGPGGANTVLDGFTLRNGYVTTAFGGGSYGGTLRNCILTANTAGDIGGGAYSGRLYNCILSGNTALNYGGGGAQCYFHNCLVTDNSAKFGGGTYSGVVIGSTIAGNSGEAGAGMYYGYATNTIVWGNSSTGGGGYSNWDTVTFGYSCMEPIVVGGTGNICVDPVFVDAANGDFRLSESSPCIDAGENGQSVGDLDLGGGIRIQGLAVDLGAYEFLLKTRASPVSVPYAWLDLHHLVAGGDYEAAAVVANGKKNADGTPILAWQEYVTGTTPSDPNSVFRCRIDLVDETPVLRWDPDLGGGRVYTVWGKAELTDPVWVTPTNEMSRFFKVGVSIVTP